MTKQIATTALLEADVGAGEQRALAARLAETGLLNSDAVDVDLLSTEAADVTVSGQFRAPLMPDDAAERFATELQELSNSSKATLPLFKQGDGTLDKAGFYEIASADVDPAHPEERRVWEFRLSLSQAGSRGSHYRAVKPNPRTVSHPFGTGTDELVGIPASARKVQWFDPATGDRTTASPASTVATAGPDVERYELADGRSALSADRVELVYAVAYPEDVFGVRTYDSDGNADRFDLDDVRQWQVIHNTGHDVDDPIVLATGRLRVRVTEPDTAQTGAITAEEWDDNAGEWSAIDLPDNDWAPVDLDVISIDQHRLEAQLLFSDGQGSSSSVNMVLTVGDDRALIFGPPSSPTVPNDLQQLLDPIAAATEQDTQASRGLRARSEVRD